MRHRTSKLLSLALLTLLFAPSPGRSDDLTEIRASFQAEIAAFNALDRNAFVTPAHEDVVLFGIITPFVVTGKEDFSRFVKSYFDDHTSATFTPIQPKFRVAGATAIAWGHYQLIDQPKTRQYRTFYGRYTLSYSKIEGKWILAALYFSPLL